MARYIDADALLSKMPDDFPYKSSVKRVLMQATAADVVPKSEVARLEQDVTRLVQENEDLKDSNEHLAVMLEETKIELEAMRGAANSYKMHYENLASEIFEEIYKDCFDQFGYIDYAALAELKKKYTEGIKNE